MSTQVRMRVLVNNGDMMVTTGTSDDSTVCGRRRFSMRAIFFNGILMCIAKRTFDSSCSLALSLSLSPALNIIKHYFVCVTHAWCTHKWPITLHARLLEPKRLQASAVCFGRRVDSRSIKFVCIRDRPRTQRNATQKNARRKNSKYSVDPT